MSLQYLKQILPPIEEPEGAPDASTELTLDDLTEHDIGILASRFETYATSITPMKKKLEPVEKLLLSFNDEIHSLSESLLSLREQSSQLSTDLDSQRSLVDTLNPVILDLVIPPSIAESIVKEPVDEKWVENIRFITEKSQLVSKVEEATEENELLYNYKDTTAFKELQEGLKALEAKAIERVRDHMINQIRLLRRSPNLSSQVIQDKLLAVKEAFVFLKLRHEKLANQLQLAYIFTMKWYYTTRFAKYLYALQKLRLKQIDSTYVLGGNEISESRLTGLFGGLKETAYSSTASAASLASSAAGASGTTPSSRPTINEYFASVAKRMEILKNGGQEARRSIPSQIAETTPFTYWLEFPYSQWSNAVLDNVIVEYLFFIDFFLQGDEKNVAVKDLDEQIAVPSGSDQTWSQVMFTDVFKMGQEYVQWLMNYPSQIGTRFGSSHGTCGDAYAILLVIRLVQSDQFILHNEFRVPVMDEYHNSLLLQLWPQFARVIDLNCDALKNEVVSSSAFSLRSSRNQAPLAVTQQFSQFLAGLLKLAFANEDDKDERFNGEPIGMSVTRLRNDFEGALTRASSRMFGAKKKGVEKEIFLFNNYFLALTILKNEFDEGSHAFIDEQISHFQMLCDAYKQH